tara:strand:- start:317 stop:496 length:180 start_codon:yes stop_codon:yes gene_type:complete
MFAPFATDVGVVFVPAAKDHIVTNVDPLIIAFTVALPALFVDMFVIAQLRSIFDEIPVT